MKTIIILAVCIVFVSCQNPNDIAQIKTRILGNFLLGGDVKDYRTISDSLRRTGDLTGTNFSNYPYIKITKNTINSTETLFFFPKFYFNVDSIITKVIFYVYRVEAYSDFFLNSPVLSYSELKSLYESKEINTRRNNFLIKNFSTNDEIDNIIKCPMPNITQGNYYDNLIISDNIIRLLKKSHGEPSHSNESGVKSDIFYYKESLWEKDKLKIRFISRRYYNEFLSDEEIEFFHILIYEFNDDTMNKYGLIRKGGIEKSF